MKTTLKKEKRARKEKSASNLAEKVRDREPRPVHSSSEIAIGYVAGRLKKRAAQQNESNRVRSAIGHAGSLAACQAAE